MKFFAPFLFLGNLVVVLLIWWHGIDSFSLISIGRLFGFLAFYLVLWQLLLIGRVGWIEKYWGHDRLSRLHHKNGIVTWTLLVLHPVLIILGYSSLTHRTFVDQFFLY